MFDYVFSAWLDWGTFGLGTASALSFLFGCLPLLWFFVGKKTGVTLRFKGCFSWSETRDIFKAGVPFMALNQCAASFLQATKRINASQLILVAECFAVLVALVYLLGHLMGEKGVFMAYGLSEALLTLILYAIVCFKRKKVVTKFGDIELLPNEFGVDGEHYLHDDIHSMEEAVAFSDTARQFCLDRGVDSGRADHVALCIREVSESSLTHSSAESDMSLTVRLFVEQDGRIVVYVRDDGRPLSHEDRQRLDNGQTRAVAIEMSCHASYGMNNTTVVL